MYINCGGRGGYFVGVFRFRLRVRSCVRNPFFNFIFFGRWTGLNAFPLRFLLSLHRVPVGCPVPASCSSPSLDLFPCQVAFSMSQSAMGSGSPIPAVVGVFFVVGILFHGSPSTTYHRIWARPIIFVVMAVSYFVVWECGSGK